MGDWLSEVISGAGPEGLAKSGGHRWNPGGTQEVGPLQAWDEAHG